MSRIIIAIIIIIIIIIIVAVVGSLMGSKLPAGVVEGDNIECPGGGKFYKIENGKKRWYSWDAFVKYGQPQRKVISCDALNSIPEGANMV
jgi:hypothetical protein